MLKYIIKDNPDEDHYLESFFAWGKIIIKELRENAFPYSLFYFFEEYCFDPSAEAYMKLQNFMAKLIYSLFMDIFYSRSYLKKEKIKSLRDDFISLLELIFYMHDVKSGDFEIMVDRIVVFLETLKLNDKKLIENNQIQEHLNKRYYNGLPVESYDVYRFYNGLIKQFGDFNEWDLYSNTRAFRYVLFWLKTMCLNVLKDNFMEIDKIRFFSMGIAGAPICYNLQQMFRDEDITKVSVDFLNDKIFTPGIRGDPLEVGGEPIFIFDAVISTCFHLYYSLKVLEELKMTGETKIFYVVISDVRNENAKKHYDQILKQFGRNQENFKLISLASNKSQKSKKKNPSSLYKIVKYLKNEEKSDFPDDDRCIKCRNLLNHFDHDDIKTLEEIVNIKLDTETIENSIGYCYKCEILYIKRDKAISLKNLDIYPLNGRII